MSTVDLEAAASEPVRRVLERLEDPKREGESWRARCPAHDDRVPSLSVREGADGRCLVRCHAGCDLTDVVAALRLAMCDLFVDATPNHTARRQEPEAVYPYVDEQGNLLFEVCRLPGKRFRQRRPDPTAQNGYRWDLNGVRRVLYRLPRVLEAAATGERVFVPEGEKDVEALERAGAIATCNPGGAGKWRPEYAQALRGADVVIVADRDEAGRHHAHKVATSLIGLARLVSVVQAVVGKDAFDHLAAGHGLEQFEPVEAPSRPAQSNGNGGVHPYHEGPGSLYWHKSGRDGVEEVLLANFTARITADTLIDDGSGETRRTYTLTAHLHSGETRELEVTAASFAAMSWVTELGADAVLSPGQSTKDRARHAIQVLSAGEMRQRRVFGHVGWRELDGEQVWVHAGGAIGARGALPDVEVELPAQLRPLELPAPPEDPARLAAALRAVLELLELAPDVVSVPLLGAVWRAPLGAADFMVHLTGSTGAFKSELAALAQQHYGPGFDSRNLPGAWLSTGNALEQLAFTAKDSLLVVDDFAPGGAKQDIARQNREAERLIRAQGNNSARGRLTADGRMRPARPPRGLTLSTGEDVPRGSSVRARIVVLELSKGDIASAALLRAQDRAVDGLYAEAMAGFLTWLAGDRGQRHRAQLKRRTRELRDTAAGAHARAPANIASLACGLEALLCFARDVGALSDAQADATWRHCWAALGQVADAQAEHQRTEDPTARFLSLLASSLVAGHAHLTDRDGTAPSAAQAWGWRQRRPGQPEPAPGSEQIGWLDGETVYLQPGAAYRAAQRAGEDTGHGLSVSQVPLQRQLHERGLLVTGGEAQSRHTVRRTLGGAPNRRVLQLTPAARDQLLSVDAEPEPPPGSPTPSLPVTPPLLPAQDTNREGDIPERYGRSSISSPGSPGPVADRTAADDHPPRPDAGSERG